MSTTHASESVAVVVTRRVPLMQSAAFDAVLAELIRAAARHEGHVAAEVLRGSIAGAARDYHIIYRFADESSLRSWEASPERRRLLTGIEAIGVENGRGQLTGMEAWFDLPGKPPPTRSRMALLTWLGIWPLVSLALRFLVPHLLGVPFLLRTALITALLVAAMTYAMMPLLVRVFATWLERRRADSTGARSGLLWKGS